MVQPQYPVTKVTKVTHPKRNGDVLKRFPPEIWAIFIAYACYGEQYMERLLSLLFVSPFWFNKILDCPILWAKIWINDSVEDPATTLGLFLSLSKSSSLSLRVSVPCRALESICSILEPHKHRIEETVLQPCASGYMVEDRQLSNTLDYLLQQLGPLTSLKAIDVATQKPIQLGKNFDLPPTLVSTGNWAISPSILHRAPKRIFQQRRLVVQTNELIDAGWGLSRMPHLDALWVHQDEREYIESTSVPIGHVNFNMTQLTRLRYHGQIHWVAERLLFSVRQTLQHLEIQIAIQDLEYATRCLETASALKSLVINVLALDSVFGSMSRRALHLPQSVANWKTRLTQSSESMVHSGNFGCRMLGVDDETLRGSLWTAFHHACPRITSLLQILPLESAAIQVFVMDQQYLDSQPTNRVLPLVPEEMWEARHPSDITEAMVAEAIIVDVMNSIPAGLQNSQDYAIYAMSSNPEGMLRFHWGEPIPVLWLAPLYHSRKGWVGIYPDGANATSVTTENSVGLWVPLYAEEWDGDIELPDRQIDESERAECGELVFQGFTLPWHTGHYELRHHADGSQNMAAEVRGVEIYLDRPERTDYDSLRQWLLKITCLALDSDPDLLPKSALSPTRRATSSRSSSQLTMTSTERSPPTPRDDMPLLSDEPISLVASPVDGSFSMGDPTSHDPSQDPSQDNFTFWRENGKPIERQAKRIAYAIEEALEVKLTPQEIMGQPNVCVITHRIRELLELQRQQKPILKDPTDLKSRPPTKRAPKRASTWHGNFR
ncbi:hypothetical protein M408DRAFT_26001 [Serendipita vermifera MAFF 305830]|uniref:Uncharacterized protein n=1 Tax=Serendipita vermifera MAFF 305830 TaxID=933852 RepID=A0A0C3B2E3_SERVB|nr:hypothetical protein M408DRAFT_26001 [Serendipita vermifera MAFF 305830]